MTSENESVRQVVAELKKRIGMKNGKAKYALFAEDAADFVKRLTLANKRDHWKIVAILKILTGVSNGK